MHLIVILAVTAVVCGLAGCDVKPAARGGGQVANVAEETAQNPAAEDQQIELLLAGKDPDGDKVVPVDEFFAKLGQGAMIWKGDVEWFKKLAADSKAAGSPPCMPS